MKRAKNTRKEAKKPIPLSLFAEKDEWLKGREPDQMIDDHGPAILGARDRKPKLPKTNDDH